MVAILPVHQTAIVNLYTALFNRAPDASGLVFWAQAYADGASLASITQTFLASPEGRSTYPAAQGASEFVAAFYQTAFGRSPDAGGLSFWTSVLEGAGGAGADAARALLVAQIVGTVSVPLQAKPADLSDAQYSQTVADRAMFGNKLDVGLYFAVSLGGTDLTLARQTLALVTADPASIGTARGFADQGGLPDVPSVLSVPPAPTLAITRADGAADITSKFAAYPGALATVDATGMSSLQLAVVAAEKAKIAPEGIRGALALDRNTGNTEIAALLAKYSGTTATINAAGMDVAQLTAVAQAVNLPETAMKIAATGITNLALGPTESTLTNPLLRVLLAHASAATYDATGADAQRLQVIADNITHLADGGITGTMQLSAGPTADQLAALLGDKTPTTTNVQVSLTAMITAQLAAIGANPTKIDSLVGSLALDLGDPLITTVVAQTLLSRIVGSTVTATDAPSANVAVLLENLMRVASMSISGVLPLTFAQFSGTSAAMLESRLALGASLAVTGTSDDETFDLSGYTRPVRVNGGAGSDTVLVSGRTLLGAASTSTFASVESLLLKGAATAYLNRIPTVSQVSIDASLGAVTVHEMTSTQASNLKILGGTGSAIALNLSGAAASFRDTVKGEVTTASAIDLSGISLPDVETLELVGTGPGLLTLTTAHATSLAWITVVNAVGGTKITIDAAHTGSGLVIDARSTGAATIDASAYAPASGVSVYGGNGGARVTGSAGADTLTGGAGKDTFVFAKNSSTLTAMDHITDLDLGTDISSGAVDKLVLQFQGGAAVARVIQLIPAQEATLNTNAAAANSVTPAVTSLLGNQARNAGDIVKFSLPVFSKTYILFNGDGNASFNPATDYLIDVTGVVGTLNYSDIQLVA